MPADPRDVLTDRLHLTAITAITAITATVDSDVEALFAITSDPRTWWYDPDGRHRTLATTADWMARAEARWRTDGMSYWLVRHRAAETDTDTDVIGVGGCQRQRTGNWNLFYRFSPAAWGRGYATELARAAVTAAREHDPLAPVLAWIDEHNTASRRVTERLGFVLTGSFPDPSDGRVRLRYADRELPAELAPDPPA